MCNSYINTEYQLNLNFIHSTEQNYSFINFKFLKFKLNVYLFIKFTYFNIFLLIISFKLDDIL
jgi:hypothetical protein